jgi:hypothetical protein
MGVLFLNQSRQLLGQTTFKVAAKKAHVERVRSGIELRCFQPFDLIFPGFEMDRPTSAQPATLPAGRENVVDDHIDTIGQKPVDHVATDETGHH